MPALTGMLKRALISLVAIVATLGCNPDAAPKFVGDRQTFVYEATQADRILDLPAADIEWFASEEEAQRKGFTPGDIAKARIKHRLVNPSP